MTLGVYFGRLYWIVPRKGIRLFHWSLDKSLGYFEISCYSDQDYYFLHEYFSKKDCRLSSGILFPRNEEIPDFPDPAYNRSPLRAIEIYGYGGMLMEKDLEDLKSYGYYGVGYDRVICLK